MTTTEANWIEWNHQQMVKALAEVRTTLDRHTADAGGAAPDEAPAALAVEAGEAMKDAPAALDTVCEVFGLSSFEREILVLCAGMELDSSMAARCAAAQGDPTKQYPTFSLALAAFAEPHWSALTPDAPLRRWRLIEVAGAGATPLTASPLRIDERVLHYLAGLHHLDERLAGLIEPVPEGGDLVPSHRALATQIATELSAGKRQPLIELCGADEASRRAIAATACAMAGLHLCAVAAEVIPTNVAEMEGLARLWERESALMGSALYVASDAIDTADAHAVATVKRWLERVGGLIVLSTRERWRLPRRLALTLDIPKASAAEQKGLWHETLGGVAASLNGHIDSLVGQFDLDAPAIRAAVHAATVSGEDEALPSRLWEAARVQARPRLEDLAQRLRPVATWQHLVLPEADLRLLRDIAAQVKLRTMVYEQWGFGTMSNRGLGLGALFTGGSGTGKTMAAEVLANELRLDLYRIDLSSVVSKYIGETEKNLRRVFDAAEDGGAILFFDEADALFGKRSEVKDSHDRYANVEISYLLQRMEAYRGLAVLATNMRGAIDTAFLRRIRFVVTFAFPDVAQRAEIWRRIFPSSTPTGDLDIDRLAQLNVAGGNIRNIALNAAFLAAAAGERVSMGHLLYAARTECAKIEKPLTDMEIRGWV